MTSAELKKIYDAIMNKEVEKAQELVDSSYLNRQTVLHELKKYSKTKSIEEQKIYEREYEFFIASYCDYFKIAISLINELVEKGYVDFNDYSSYVHVQQALKNFKRKFPEYNIYVDNILKEIEIKKKEKTKRLKIENFYNVHNHERSKYEDEFYMVITSNNPVGVFNRFNWSERLFYSKLNSFKKKYPEGEDAGIAEKLENWFREYLQLYNKNQKINEINEKNNEYQAANLILKNVFASGLSIYEYCHLNAGYRVAEIKKYVKQVYCNDEENGKESTRIIRELEERENPKFINELNYIKEEIMFNDKFTVIDYYLLTKLNIDDFLQKVGIDSMMNQFIWNNFQTNHIRFASNVNRKQILSINKSRELKLLRSINGREITIEEKEAIFKYFEENEIPLNDATYMVAIRKIINNEIDFISKINTYKKGSI